MEKDFYQHIEAYIIGTLDKDTLKGFEKAMRVDAELKAAVQDQRIEWELHEMMAENALRTQIKKRFSQKNSPPENPRSFLSSYGFYVLAAVLGIAAFFVFKQGTPPAPTVPKTTQEKKNPLQENSDLPVQNPLEIQEESKKTTKKKIEKKREQDQKQIVPVAKNQAKEKYKRFALAQYDIPDGLSGVRGQAGTSAFGKAETAFFEKNYAETIILLQNLPEDERQEALRIRAHANFNAGLYDAAARDFSTLEAGGIYRRECQWYGVLSRLAFAEELEESDRTILNKIINRDNHPYQEKAQKLLQLIKE